jgi:hypothetical protein
MKALEPELEEMAKPAKKEVRKDRGGKRKPKRESLEYEVQEESKRT